jgi:hypothetical protein
METNERSERGGDAGPSGRAAPPAARGGEADGERADPRICLGALFFSLSRYERLEPPLCAGFQRAGRSDAEDATAAAAVAAADELPPGAFRYLCLGAAAYDPAELRRAARRAAPGDPVRLPFCEGLEVVSAAAGLGAREPLGAAAAGAAAGAPARPPPDSAPPAPRPHPGRTFVPGGAGGGAGGGGLPGEGMDLARFAERFGTVSRRMVDRMALNAAFMSAAVRKSWDAARGGGGGGGKRRER